MYKYITLLINNGAKGSAIKHYINTIIRYDMAIVSTKGFPTSQ